MIVSIPPSIKMIAGRSATTPVAAGTQPEMSRSAASLRDARALTRVLLVTTVAIMLILQKRKKSDVRHAGVCCGKEAGAERHWRVRSRVEPARRVRAVPRKRSLGGFILVDRLTNTTVGAGLL